MQKIIGSSTTNYFYDTLGHVVAEVDGSGSWQKGYAYLGGQFLAEYSNGTTYFAHADHLGSTRVLTDVNGGGYDNYDYLPFGERMSGGTGTTHYFTGDERDSETSLDHTLFRQYASTLGRWTSPDPLAGDISDPQSLNRYAYVKNSPLNGIDPFGLDDCNQSNHFCDLPLMDNGFGSGANSDFVQWSKVPTRIDNPFVRIITGAGPGMVSANIFFPNGGSAPVGADVYSTPAEFSDSSTSVLINDPGIAYWTTGLAGAASPALFTISTAGGPGPAPQTGPPPQRAAHEECVKEAYIKAEAEASETVLHNAGLPLKSGAAGGAGGAIIGCVLTSEVGCVEGGVPGALTGALGGVIEGAGKAIYGNAVSFYRVRRQLLKDIAACGN